MMKHLALALATAQRLRDVTIFFPGLLVWQWAEHAAAVDRRAKRVRASPLAHPKRDGSAQVPLCAGLDRGSARVEIGYTARLVRR